MPLKPYLNLIQSGETLSLDQMQKAMDIIMSGDAPDVQLAAFLSALAMRGETSTEITGAAKVLRSKSSMIKAPENALDCCGTGGDGAHTYNISTAVAFVVAACGVPTAKHGNRSASSKSGAADVLEALGVNLDISIEAQEKALQDLNFCFLMAPKHHQAMKHVGPVRKELGFRTFFNLIGPLANPASTKFQLIGVFDKKWLVPMAEALNALGTKRAMVVHGYDGLDEITVCDKTKAVLLKDGQITEFTLSPEMFGVSMHSAEDLKGGDADYNAKALRSLLQGDQGAYRDIVIANSAAVLSIHHDNDDYAAMAELAAKAIDSGDAKSILDRYIAIGAVS